MREVYSFPLRKKRIAVKVKKIGKNKFRVVPGVCVLEESTLVCEQPFFQIVGDDGEEIPPTGTFLWTAETIDPYHLVTDWF